MKRIALVICLAVLTAFMLTACSSSSFGVESSGDNGIKITAKNAAVDASATGTLTVEGKQNIVFDAADLITGKLSVLITDEEGSEVVESSVSAKEKAMFDITESGEYTAKVSVLEKADGTATIIAGGE